MNPHLAWLGAHKVVLLGGGAAVVGFWAYRNRAAAQSDTSAAVDTSGTSPQGATVAGYDSTGQDVYNALQPQIEQTQTMLRKLLNRQHRKPGPHHTTRPPQHPTQHHHGQGHQTPPTKPVPHRRTRLPVATTPAPGRRRLPPAPIAVPTAVVTRRRKSTLGTVATASGTNLVAVMAANKGITPAAPLPPGTRVVLPPSGGRS